MPIASLLASVQAVLPDLKARKGALLVTNGGFGLIDPQIDAYAVQSNNAGLALANAAKHKLVGLLSAQLKDDGVYVGEVVVSGAIKGSAWDSGNATIDPKDIAARFWSLYSARSEVRAKI